MVREKRIFAVRKLDPLSTYPEPLRHLGAGLLTAMSYGVRQPTAVPYAVFNTSSVLRCCF